MFFKVDALVQHVSDLKLEFAPSNEDIGVLEPNFAQKSSKTFRAYYIFGSTSSTKRGLRVEKKL